MPIEHKMTASEKMVCHSQMPRAGGHIQPCRTTWWVEEGEGRKQGQESLLWLPWEGMGGTRRLRIG